ncbi:dihydrolipoamide acetyltransferase family protein [Sphingomonas sp.]|uniref:dihydrolipoamide acetyltransferase family protein n=1 Tax=Sphingomonas sp. TaxID=28214 RepID=UPI002FC8A00E
MARYEFKLPDVGEGIAEAEIAAWHVKVGDHVEEDQQIADVMTDKATVEMESPVAGRVVALAGEVGDQIAIGSVLVVLDTENGAAPVAGDRHDTIAFTDGLIEKNPALAAVEPSTAEADASDDRRSGDRRDGDRRGGDRRDGDRRSGDEDRRKHDRGEPDRRSGDRRDGERRDGNRREGDRRDADKPKDEQPPGGEEEALAVGRAPAARALASPAVRQRARDLGIDLSQVKSAGGDRIRHSDLDAYLLYNGGAAPHGAAARPRRDEQVKVVGLRRRIAENLQEAKRRIPHFSYVEEVDVTALENTREMMNADRGDNPRLTLLPFLITAICRALTAYPQINARYDDEANVVTRHGAVHMGVATQTANGLAVPVIRDAQDRDLWSLASEIARLAEETRDGTVAREDLSGSTITISSLGPLGGIVSTPVINRPEVAIVAINKVVARPVAIEQRIEIRKMMNLSSSFDHRVVDGWDAASFIQEVKRLLEHPLLLLSLR